MPTDKARQRQLEISRAAVRFFLAVSAVFAFRFAEAATSAVREIEAFKKNERVLILAPHPDDESIGCAGVIQQALSQGAEVKIVYLTNGDHNQFAFIVYEKRVPFKKGAFVHLGELRRKEAIDAMRKLGLSGDNLIFLGYPDYGTFTIFCRFWQSKRPFKSWLTRISQVPYQENFSFGSAYTADSILDDLKRVLLSYRPEKIFVSHPADVNCDHKALYLYLEIALSDLEGRFPRPKVFPYLIHHVGWPLPRHLHSDLRLEPPEIFGGTDINWVRFDLSAEQVEKKRQAVLCHRSQTESSAFYLLAFVRQNELFGDYPEVTLKEQLSLKDKLGRFFGRLRLMGGSQLELGEKDFVQTQAQVSYAVVDRQLLIRLQKKENFKRRLNFMVYIFPYRKDRPFARMPKLRIMVQKARVKVFDQSRLINLAGASLEVGAREAVLKVPLAALGDPEFVLVSLKAHTEALPFYSVGFRKIRIR